MQSECHISQTYPQPVYLRKFSLLFPSMVNLQDSIENYPSLLLSQNLNLGGYNKLHVPEPSCPEPPNLYIGAIGSFLWSARRANYSVYHLRGI